MNPEDKQLDRLTKIRSKIRHGRDVREELVARLRKEKDGKFLECKTIQREILTEPIIFDG